MNRSKRIKFDSAQPNGTTLVDLIVVMAIGLLTLTLALPALQHSIEAKRSTECRHNLQVIARASLEYDVVMGELPPYMAVPVKLLPGEITSDNYPYTFSLVQLLPFLGQSKAADSIDPFAFSNENLTIQQAGYPTFQNWQLGIDDDLPGIAFVFRDFQPEYATCPSDNATIDGVLANAQANNGTFFPFPDVYSAKFPLPYTNYVSNMGILGQTINSNAGPPGGYGAIRSRESDSVPDVVDGASNVAMFGESLGFTGEIPKIGFFNLRFSSALGGVALARYDLFAQGDLFGDLSRSGSIQFGSPHPDSVNFARCDGSIVSVGRDVAPIEFGKFCGAADGEKHFLD